MMPEKTAAIAEIFYSIQGEGPYIGLPFCFVRFCACNLRCVYCDTRWAWESVESCRMGKTSLPNPCLVSDIARHLNAMTNRYISFTGGEPLLSADFIESLMERCQNKVFLMETNGTIPGAITDKLVEKTDIWSVDLKLPSVSGFDCMQKHLDFLDKLTGAKHTILKAVFSDRTPLEEIQTTFETAAAYRKHNAHTDLVFQPLSSGKKILGGKLIPQILKLGESYDVEFRIIPQIHKILRIP